MTKTAKKTGFLLTFEGGEGAGKTVQSATLVKKLKQAGIPAILVREPGGTKISEEIREVVLSPENTEMFDTTEVLLYQAARAQIYHEVVLPALDEGQVVIMDRSRDSSLVYQGMVRGFGKNLVEELNNISTDNTYPDLTILLDISTKTGLKRKSDDHEENRLEMEKIDFHQQVRKAYLKVAKANDRDRWKIVDAQQDLEEVEAQIWEIVTARLKQLGLYQQK